MARRWIDQRQINDSFQSQRWFDFEQKWNFCSRVKLFGRELFSKILGSGNVREKQLPFFLRSFAIRRITQCGLEHFLPRRFVVPWQSLQKPMPPMSVKRCWII